MAKERLQKILAAAGIDSRRNCEELIQSGVVRVNRKVVDELPAFADAEEDIITVHGRRIQITDKAYYLLNKPKGVICSSKDPFGRRTAVDIVDAEERVFCVGRLDADTTGIIILTNDSELANRLTHPRYEVPKTYLVQVKGHAKGETVDQLKKGIWLAEGKTNRSAVKIVKRTHVLSTIEITIRQGLNRQLRRMFAKVDLPVKSLKRIKIGKLDAAKLGVGRHRKLTAAEVSYLKKASGMKP